MPLLLESHRLRIDVDERIGLADVAAARHDRRPAGAGGPDDVDVLESWPDRLEFALGMSGAGGREPAVAGVEAAFRSADFAGAGRAGDRQSDCLLDFGPCCVGHVPAPIEAERAELLLDLQDSEGAAFCKCGLDPGAAPLQDIPPAFLAVGVALCGVWPPRRALKQAGMGLDQIDPPILHRTRHCTDLARARSSGRLA